MKLTEARIKEIIREEVERMQEQDGEQIMKAITDVPKAAETIATKIKAEIEKLAEPSGLDPLVLGQAVAALLTAKQEA